MENIISYRVYCKNKLFEKFEKDVSWPFTWNVGSYIARKPKGKGKWNKIWYQVKKVKPIYYKNQIKIYITPVQSRDSLSTS